MQILNKIQVIDRDGWSRTFPLQKKLIYIGSDPGNDIVLGGRGGGVAARHLQLVYAKESRGGYRLINLGQEELVFRDQVLPPRVATDLESGDLLHLGDFELRFLGESSRTFVGEEAAEETSFTPIDTVSGQGQDIGLQVFLSSTRLSVDRPIDGTVTVRNQGKMPGVQFRLDVEGLTPEDYEIGPGPILFPNAEKNISLRIYHPRRPHPPAGEHRILIRATAPKEYPGQSVTVSQVVQIEPFYNHRVRLVLSDQKSGLR